MDGAVGDPLVGRLVDGRYRVGRRIARGGMATVYEAADQRLGRDVALKVMHPDLAEDQDFVARFIEEAKACARLSPHRTIVTVFDQGASDGLVWLALELVRGRTLRQLLHERGRLDPATALAVIDPVLTALAAAHQAGIVHRDVKPENVLVGDDQHVQVADFGLAHAVTASSHPRRGLTTRGILLGTVAYISPEQVHGEAATQRSDVYSAGVMLSELLTGHPPHQAPSEYLVMRQHVEQDVPPPSAEAPDVPPDVDDLVLTATARDPQHRYADAGAFLAAVRAARARLGASAGDGEHLEVASAAGVLVAASRTGPVATGPAGSPAGGPAATGSAGAVARTADTGPLHHTTTTLEPPIGGPWPPSADEGPPGTAPPGAPPLLVDGPDDPFAPPPATRRRRGRRLLLVALLAAVVACLWWWVDGRMVPAPALVGMTVEQAQATAQAAGLQAQQAGEEYSETVPAGAVSSTDPVAGAKVAPGDTIGLVVSRGPERYAVPDLRGQSQEQAGQSLAALTLVPGTVGEAYDEQVPAGQVVSQDPAAGTEVKRATPVSFVVSLGRQPIPVPAVVGQARDDAVATVQGAGLVPEVTEQYSTDVDRGLVISQEPGEGTLFRGDAVALVVSLGPETVPVPSVEDMGAGEARAALEQAGFTVRRVELLPAGPNQVLRQAPAGGQSARVGSEVTIYVF